MVARVCNPIGRRWLEYSPLGAGSCLTILFKSIRMESDVVARTSFHSWYIPGISAL
jgi:hypothetical protein